MRKSISLVLTSALAALSLQLLSSTASAADNPCQIEISAEAKCEVVVSGGCTVMCEPVSFQASCAAELSVECSGMCTAKAEVSCTAACGVDCKAACMTNPGSFDCNASCTADCGASCGTHCAASANRSECEAQCKASCSGDCDARCQATPPSATCDAKCEASCGGSCEAEANFGCQVDCQSKSFAMCQADLKGGCDAACSKPEGALFCDNQYVGPRDQVNDCLAYLEESLKIEVTGYADGNAQCSGGSCTAEGEAGFSCAAAPSGVRSNPANAGALALAALGAGILVARRRRRG